MGEPSLCGDPTDPVVTGDPAKSKKISDTSKTQGPNPTHNPNYP